MNVKITPWKPGDGGLWKSQAVANVKAYLMEALKDIPERENITIIA